MRYRLVPSDYAGRRPAATPAGPRPGTGSIFEDLFAGFFEDMKDPRVTDITLKAGDEILVGRVVYTIGRIRAAYTVEQGDVHLIEIASRRR